MGFFLKFQFRHRTFEIFHGYNESKQRYILQININGCTFYYLQLPITIIPSYLLHHSSCLFKNKKTRLSKYLYL